jgi:predicted MFS family arabinose efflux permease
VLLGWIVRGTGCSLWFGFTLGLAVLGVESGRGGSFLAVGMAAYGVGSVLGTIAVVRLLRVLPVLPAIAGAWAVTGACWIVIGRVPDPTVVGVVALVSGCGVAVGNAGITAQITRGSVGRARRTLMAGQSVVVNAASSLGLLVGGPVLGALGAARTLQTTGAVVVLVATTVLVVARGQAKRAATSAARAPYPPPKRHACTSSG